MAGSYRISRLVEHPSKFACWVEYNGKAECYHESQCTTAEGIRGELQASANDDFLAGNLSVSPEASLVFNLVDGQIVGPDPLGYGPSYPLGPI